MVKNPPASAGDMRCGFDPWVGKIPWRRAWQPTPVSLHGEPRPHGDTSIEKRCPLLGWGPSNGHCPADPPGAAGTDGCLVKLSLSGRSLLGCRGLLGCDTKSSSCFAQISETAALWEQKKSDVWNTCAQNKDEMTCSKMYFFNRSCPSMGKAVVYPISFPFELEGKLVALGPRGEGEGPPVPMHPT